MNIDEILSDLENNVFHKAATAIRKLTEVEQLNLETSWTDYIQNQVDFGNKHYLRNFSLRLEIDQSEGTMEHLAGR
jgi:hypothetical protein